jgi:hypothetical protein
VLFKLCHIQQLIGWHLCCWTISPRGYHSPSSHCFVTAMVYKIYLLLKLNLQFFTSINNVSWIHQSCLGSLEFVQFRQVFGLHRFKLHRHLVDGTVKSVWFRQVFGLLRVQFRQVFGLLRVQFRQVFGLLRVQFRQVFGLLRVQFRQVFGLLGVQFRQVSL